uniref:RNA-directed DNA polymerase n=1 Tax=Strongyloides venezuelensis TaxID=75913 RepID=A0A0K0FEP9_STRVS
MEKYDGVVARRIASDKIRYFKLKYSENELENSINAFGKLIKDSLDTTDDSEVLQRQLSRLKEKLEDNYELFIYFRNKEDRYTSIAEVASDLQVIHNDNVRLSKTHNQSNHRRKEMIKTREDKKNDLSCRGCFNKGHKVSDCRYKNVECKKCRGKGHYANKCPVQTSSQPTVSNNLRTLTIHSSDTTNPWEKLKNCMMITTEEVESTGKLADAQISDYVSSNGEGIKELAEKCDKNLLSINYVNEKCDEKTSSKKCVIKDCDKEVISKIYVNNETNGILPSKNCEKLSKRVTTNSCDVYVKVEFEDGFIAPGIVDSGCQRSSISLNRAKILGFNVSKTKPEKIFMANGNYMKSYGTFVTTLKFDNVMVKTNCCVLPDECFSEFKHHLFIGTDVLKATCSVLDFEKNTLKMCNRYVSVIVKFSSVKKTTFFVKYNDISECTIENCENIDKIKSDYYDRFSNHKYDIGACKIKCPTLRVSSEDPPKIKRYPIPVGKSSLVVETIKLWEENKICIRNDNVTWLMNMVLVPKRDNQDRICLDSRPLNNVLIGDSYTTPTLADIRCKLVNGKYFTTLDLTQSFMQIMLDETSSMKLGFKSPTGHTYRFLRMPFGLKIATAVFQRTIDKVLNGFDFALSYVDDILIVTKTTMSDHFTHIRLVLDRLREYDLKINCSKSQFCGTSVLYLGYIFSADGQKPCDSNVAAIVNYPSPKSVKSLRRYLGKIGYFRNNIPNLAKMQKALTDLLRNKTKNSSFHWSEEAETSFLKTKQALVEAVTISYPNFKLPFKLYCDASADCFAAVLMQEFKKNIDTPLGFFSKRNPDRKKFVPATYLEIRCIAESLDYFRQYVYGHETHVYTDHMSILKICENNTDRNLFRYVEKILENNVILHYIRGERNIPADALSRAHLLRVINVKDGINETNNIVTENKKNIIKKIANIDCSKFPEITDEEKIKLMEAVHDNLGHMCFEKCYPLLVARQKWPGMSLDFRKHIQSCKICLSRNNPRKRPYQFEHTSADFPFQKVNVDICGPFRGTTNGNKFFIGLIDVLTKYIILQEIADANSESLINFFINKVIFLYSCPIEVKLDNAQYCKSKKLLQFFDDMGIKYSHSTPLHHEGNCNIERVFKTIHTLISKELKLNPDLEWDECLSKIAYFYNVNVHLTTKFSPFFLIFGRNPVLKSDVILDHEKLKYIVDYDLNNVINKCHIQNAHKLAKELSDITREKLNGIDNADYSEPNNLNIGDKVLIKRPNFKNEKKHDCPWQSGYEVTDVFKNYVECRIRNPTTNTFKGRPRKVFFTDVKLDTSRS